MLHGQKRLLGGDIQLRWNLPQGMRDRPFVNMSFIRFAKLVLKFWSLAQIINKRVHKIGS